MFSFLDQPLFDESPNGSTPSPAPQVSRQMAAPLQPARHYGAGDVNKPPQGNGPNQQAPVAQGPIQCHDRDSLAAIEHVMKSQAMADKRMQSMESKILNVLEQLASTASKQKETPQGVSLSSMLWIGAALLIFLLFIGMYMRQRSATPMEFMLKTAVPSNTPLAFANASTNPLTPILLANGAGNGASMGLTTAPPPPSTFLT